MGLMDGYNSMQLVTINHGLELIGVAVMMELYSIHQVKSPPPRPPHFTA